MRAGEQGGHYVPGTTHGGVPEGLKRYCARAQVKLATSLQICIDDGCENNKMFLQSSL